MAVVYLVRRLELDARRCYPVIQQIPQGRTRMKNALSILVFMLLGSFGLLGTATTAAAQDQDPPTRVARLNYVQGSISYQLSGEQDWVGADPNRPLTTGDNLWVDQDSRGEIHIGSTAIRLAAQTGIAFLNLDDRTIQVQLAQGEIEVHLRRLEPGTAVEIDTPNLAFTLANAGEYVIFADPNGTSTVITVREGDGEVSGGGDSFDLPAGQQYAFTGTDQLTYDAQPLPQFDDLEAFSQQRDQRENGAASAQYVSRDIDGYYDLDDYGDWQTDPDYGAVWIPRGVFVGWAPYQDGHWVWINPWGWTWVDAQPWGFAPFHYGRWVYARNAWGWVPGPVVVRPVYAPALVAFVGGGGFGVSIGFGEGFAGVAWFPLGPRDVFVPSYRCSPRYWQNVNVTNSRVVTVTQVTNIYNTVHVNNVTNVTNVHYTYEHNAAAVTAVSRETFVNARPVAHANVKINETQLAAARVTDAAPLQPTRASYVSATAKPAPRSAQPPVPFSERKVVAKLPPPMPASSHDAPRVVSAGVSNSQSGARPTPTTVEANRNALPERPQPTPPQASRPEVYEKQNPPSARENEQQPNDRQNSAAQQHQQRTANDNRPPAEQQQHPAVKFTPPTRAKDQMYDVHPPLNEQQQQRPAQQQEKSSPPPQKQSPPPPAAHAEPSKPK
jgi:hypothetical protein